MRDIPSNFDERTRLDYIKVADRCRDEAVSCYTLVSIGAQMYAETKKFKESLDREKRT